MDSLIESLKSAGPLGAVVAALLTILAGLAGGAIWLARQLWYWACREPDANTGDPGGWITRWIASNIEANDCLKESVKTMSDTLGQVKQDTTMLVGRECPYGLGPPKGK